MFPHTTHNVCMKWKRSSIFENIQFRYLLKELNDSWFVQYLPPLPPALQKMSVIYDHIVSEWHIEDRCRQYHAHHDHCHHVGGQEGGTWGSGSYFICLLLPPLRVGRGKGGVLSLFPNIFPHIAEKKISPSRTITSALFSQYSWWSAVFASWIHIPLALDFWIHTKHTNCDSWW